jgi:hypothetical protein
MKSTIALFLITIILFLIKPQFFELLYGTPCGRLILITILIIIAINSILLALLLFFIIIFLSRNKKKVRFVKPLPPKNDLDVLSMEEVITKNYQEKNDETFLFKKHKNVQYKSKRKNGVNVIQISETLRPKPSKNMIVIPNIPNIETTPYFNKSFYHI